MFVRPGAVLENMRRAEGLIERAASDGARVVLLPEAWPCGWTDASARSEAGAVPEGAHCEFLRTAAKAFGVHVCAGVVERAGENLFNSAVLIDPSGALLLHHRKIHELEIARELYAVGTEDRLAVVGTECGVFGIMICADGFAPGQWIGRRLASLGAQVILSPCAWAVPAAHDNLVVPYGGLWLDNYQPVAGEHRVWIAAASNVGPITGGPWAGRRCIGCSMVVAPGGDVVARGPYGSDESAERILCVDVRLTEGQGLRGGAPRPGDVEGRERVC
jgi:predicted amidohydrolase